MFTEEIYHRFANRLREKTRRKFNIHKQSFLDFILETFPGYDVSWHHLILINLLERWMNKEFPNLIICVPPRHGKSLICSIELPAYIFSRDPDIKIIATSYSASLAGRFSRHTQRVMELPCYIRRYPDSQLPSNRDSQQRTASLFEIKGQDGIYLSAGVNGGITGEGADFGIIDDPVKNRKDANSPVYQEGVWDWYKSTFKSRLHKNASQLLIQTRWSEADLAGKLLDEQPEKWVYVNMPAMYDPDLCIGYDDPRKNKGASLWKNQYNKAFLLDVEETQGPFEFSALYQGDPYSQVGSIFRADYWQYYEKIPENVLYIEQAWDTAFKDGEQNSYSVCTTWAVTNTGYYLLHRWKQRVKYPELIQAVKDLAGTWKPSRILVEDKASGQSAVQTLRKETRLPIIAIQISGDKVARANSCVGVIASGRCYLPKDAMWKNDYLEQMRKFPNAKHDDDVDSTTLFLNQAILRDGSSSLNIGEFGRGLPNAGSNESRFDPFGLQNNKPN